MTSTNVEIQALIDNHRVSGLQITIVFLCFLIAVLDGLDVGVIGSLAPSIAQDWTLLPGQLGEVFGAGLFGLMLGAFAFGPLADRFGRKNVLLLTVFGFGVVSLASGFAHGVSALTMLRFATGFFLGGALPNALTLTSEYAPTRHRFLMVTAIPCGFTIGGALGGVVVAQLVTDIHKWRHVLFLGGILPLLLVPILYFALPESVRYLVVRGSESQRIRRILCRIAPRVDLANATFALPSAAATRGGSLSQMFARDLRIGTILLWITFFMGLLLYYLLISWLPIVISTSGTSMRDAILLSAMFPVGSTVGAITLGALMDRFNPYRILMFAFIAGGIAVGLIGYVYSLQWALGAAILFAGFGNGGSVVGANALSAAFYPVTVRATGVSWALGIGRAGSIAGSMVGSLLLSLHWGLPVLFALIAVPAMLAAASMLTMGRLPSTRPPAPVASAVRST